MQTAVANVRAKPKYVFTQKEQVCCSRNGYCQIFLLFEQYGVKILITSFWDTQYTIKFVFSKLSVLLFIQVKLHVIKYIKSEINAVTSFKRIRVRHPKTITNERISRTKRLTGTKWQKPTYDQLAFSWLYVIVVKIVEYKKGNSMIFFIG